MGTIRSTYGPIIYFLIMLSIVIFGATSCSSSSGKQRSQIEILQTEGLDRLMVEECGMFHIVPEKGIAVDTALMAHQTRWRHSVYKLNPDSTRYIMCK